MSEVNGLVIDGQAIAVTGAGNQMVTVVGSIVVINEQVVAETATTSSTHFQSITEVYACWTAGQELS